MFASDKLVFIEVEPPTESGGCFEPLRSDATNIEQAFYAAGCRDYPSLLQALTNTLGPATILVSPKVQELHAMRWENNASVVELRQACVAHGYERVR